MAVAVQLRPLSSALLAAALAVGVLAADEKSPPLARVRLILTTTARTAGITIDGATLASYRPSSVSPGDVAATHGGRTLQLSNPRGGQPAEATFDVVVADAARGAAVTWSVDTDVAGDTHLEVYALNDFARPRLVDRFESTAQSARFTSRV